jgi:hypothetical protein
VEGQARRPTRRARAEGRLDIWDDRRIAIGDDWLPEIEQAMNAAKVAVLLISADFLVSKFIRGVEVPRLLQRRQDEGLRIVPVLVRPCAWKKSNGWRRSRCAPVMAARSRRATPIGSTRTSPRSPRRSTT